MATPVYVAISATNRTGDLVVGGEGATYAATFANFTTAFEDATVGARDQVTLDQRTSYDLFLDASPLDDSAKLTETTGTWNTSPSHTITIRAEPNSTHGGSVTAGAQIKPTTGSLNSATILPVDNTIIEDLRIATRSYCSGVGAAGFIASGVQIRRSIITAHQIGVAIRGDLLIDSCLTYECADGIKFEVGGSSAAVTNSIMYNNRGRGIAVGYNPILVRNCASFNNAGGDFTGYNGGGGVAESASNASGDATASTFSPAGGGLDNVLLSSAFVDAPGYDFNLAAGSPLAGAGVDVSASGVRDITGQPFQAPFPIGVFQPGQFTVPVELNNVPLGTEVRIFDNASNAELVGIESSMTSPVVLDMPYPGVPVNVRIVLLNMAYRYQVLTTEIGPNGLSFPVTFFRDRVYKNP
jgi:hypothetical protein